MTTNNYDAIIIGGGERAGLKPPAQCMEALRAGARSRLLADFHELRQDFSPTDKMQKENL